MSKHFTTTCKYNTSCKKENCTYLHAIPFNFRQKILQIIEEHPEIREQFFEDDLPEVRLAYCRFGQLCNKSTCNYKHGLTFDGRKKMSELFYAKK